MESCPQPLQVLRAHRRRFVPAARLRAYVSRRGYEISLTMQLAVHGEVAVAGVGLGRNTVRGSMLSGLSGEARGPPGILQAASQHVPNPLGGFQGNIS
jgi:hypothetical protein